MLDDSPCKIDEELDETKEGRFEKCSSKVGCYESATGIYDNNKCRPDEHCMEIIEGNAAIDHGCFLARYCTLKGTVKNKEVEFRCPTERLKMTTPK